MKYFGTDGIRGVVGKGLSTATIKKLGKAIIKFFDVHKLRRVLLVGNDSRISSDWIVAAIEAEILKHGIEVHNVGVSSSPCLAYLTRRFGYPLGMMISASHNSHEYNGIKFFNYLGEKISEETELELEKYMDKKFAFKTDYALAKDKQNLKADYINFLKTIKKCNPDCVIDCANGGASDFAKLLFPSAHIINHIYTGKNINLDAGCTHIEFLQSICKREHKIGFAFDGDADRLLAVDENGEIFDGDKILYILSGFFQRAGDTIVGTIYSNMGLEKAVEKREIKFERAQVGDKLVYKKMNEVGASLGGEISGHIILKQFTNTGDGVLNAIVLMNILDTTKKTLKDLTNGYCQYHQENENLKLNRPFEMSKNTQSLIARFENLGARIIVRPSGTEPVLRLMVEHKDEETANKFMRELKNSINNENL